MSLDQFVATDKKATRDGFGAGLHELGNANPDVVALCADLVGSLKMQKFISGLLNIQTCIFTPTLMKKDNMKWRSMQMMSIKWN